MEDQVNMAIGLIKERMASGMAPRILEIPADLKKFMDEKNLLQKKDSKDLFLCHGKWIEIRVSTLINVI